jgi:iron complex transport system permease protein
MNILDGKSLARHLGTAVVVLLGCCVVALGLGTGGFSLQDLREIFGGGEEAATLWETRVTRVVLGAVCGAALSTSGAALQALLRNPLADPYVLGVSGGAALGGTLAVGVASSLGGGEVLGTLGIWLLPAGAYAGAVGTLLVLWLAVRVAPQQQPVAVLLSGVVLNACCLAAVSVVRLLVRAETAQSLMGWMMGSIGSERWTVVASAAAYTGAGLVWLTVLAGPLHLIAQGDTLATRLGVRVTRVRVAALLAVSLMVAGVVSITGMIGFVGLMVPHVTRMVVGPDARVLLPASALWGAGALVLLDGVTRALFPVFGTEIPVGAITALMGGPGFLWLLNRHLRQAVAS